MNAGEVAELIERYNGAWNAQDLDTIHALHHPDVVFDNHTAVGRPRGMRFRIHPTAGTARLLEQVTDPPVVYSPAEGSARRLPGGHWLNAPPIPALSTNARTLSLFQLLPAVEMIPCTPPWPSNTYW